MDFGERPWFVKFYNVFNKLILVYEYLLELVALNEKWENISNTKHN